MSLLIPNVKVLIVLGKKIFFNRLFSGTSNATYIRSPIVPVIDLAGTLRTESNPGQQGETHAKYLYAAPQQEYTFSKGAWGDFIS